jgi:hypothetical protein
MAEKSLSLDEIVRKLLGDERAGAGIAVSYRELESW